MAILQTCCCWDSVRQGTFTSGIYTLAFYTVIFTACAFHVSTAFSSTELFIMALALLISSACCVVSSVLLIVGLCADNRKMLLPWIASVGITTFLEIGITIHITLKTELNPISIIFFLTDLAICFFNGYAILCVISQYQEYGAGRGFAGQRKYTQRLAVQGKGNTLQVPLAGEIAIRITAESSSGYRSGRGYLTIPSPSISSTSPLRSRLSTDLSSMFSSDDPSRRVSIPDEDIKITITHCSDLDSKSVTA